MYNVANMIIAAENVIASLKEQLAHQTSSAQESRLLKKQLDAQQEENERLKKQLSVQQDESERYETELSRVSGALRTAQTENQNLQSRLAASRTVTNNIQSASNIGNNKTANAQNSSSLSSDSAIAQLKEDLYCDLTGLIIRGVKRNDDGNDVFDCIQTGRNGSK
jgi:septal ring factor EnvC (AmiA/AmiB activator)